MDFSKSTLRNLDSKKAGTICMERNICNSKKNYNSTEKSRQKSNIVLSSENAILLNYTQFEPINMQNMLIRNINTSVQNISSSEHKNNLKNFDQNSVSICLNPCDGKLNEDQFENNTLKSSDLSENIEKVKGQKMELKKVAVEEETIEKIAEMIAVSTNDENGSSSKTKQCLMFRDITDPVNESVTISNNINYWTDPANENRKTLFHSSKAIDYVKETSENCILNKNRFEEIENKLEEMFAGIDDEKIDNIISDGKNMQNKNIMDSIEVKTNHNVKSTNNNIKMYVDDGLKYDKFKTLPTKAAKKSRNIITSNKEMELNASLTSQKEYEISNAVLYLKTIHQTHSSNKDLLNFSEKTNNEVNEKKGNTEFNKGNGMTTRSLSPMTDRSEKKKSKYVRKSKVKNINCVEYKKGNTKVVKSRNNKKICITASNCKSNQQKAKQNLLPSENDTEEKSIHVKDVETKHRSPFILIKNNGSIAVINTVTADDSNEKLTRSKKSINYTQERKTVKGCHSSTLSNRYDADTADSSWICALCKIGPHKKGLGDLFGPYIISSDCDEYRCIKESCGTLHVFNKSVRNITERTASLSNEEKSIVNDMLGMSRISDSSYEIWIHEECAIWAPNIFVVGSRLTGLEDVAWNSIRYECVYCFKGGALLCCLHRDCKITSHVPCAREFNWLLDESRFWVYCNKHVLSNF
ncbi:uncharacterized protein ACRADG_009330 isoform 1-T3 [Cochliomyia hominivorax]